jgi:predicted ABC-class ATPase
MSEAERMARVELTDEDRAATDALGPDFIDRLLAGERPLGDPGRRANP